VKFIDNETKHYLNEVDGRCDRENKCGYFKNPSNNLISVNSITSSNDCNTNVLQPTYHNKDIMLKYCDTLQQSNFIVYLLSVFDEKSVVEAMHTYHIGITNYWRGATVFWQIDRRNKIRGGKIMLYNSRTGKRVKQPFNHVSWMHKELKLPNFVLQQCLFGLEILASASKNVTIFIVESEKTAIIMSLVMPNSLWLATGSKTGFKESMLQPVKAYNIIAYPDKTEFEAWNVTAQSLNKDGFSIQCSDFLEKIEVEVGEDLVDYLMDKF
jgi:hypothetical protein